MRIPDELYRQICSMMPIPCVDLVVRDEAGRILLVRRNHEPAAGEWWFPGGRIHHREIRREAARRKLSEECGLAAGSIEELGTHDLLFDGPPGVHAIHGITTLFLVDCHSGAVRLDDQSAAFDWRPAEAWLASDLHPFVVGGIESAARAGASR